MPLCCCLLATASSTSLAQLSLSERQLDASSLFGCRRRRCPLQSTRSRARQLTCGRCPSDGMAAASQTPLMTPRMNGARHQQQQLSCEQIVYRQASGLWHPRGQPASLSTGNRLGAHE
eukprot:3977732-Prymnesium_polylepis.1